MNDKNKNTDDWQVSLFKKVNVKNTELNVDISIFTFRIQIQIQHIYLLLALFIWLFVFRFSCSSRSLNFRIFHIFLSTFPIFIKQEKETYENET